MYIVQIASECAPVIKAGGLGDVVYGLSRELEIRGNTVEIILPMYDCMRYDQIWGLHDAYRDYMCLGMVVPFTVRYSAVGYMEDFVSLFNLTLAIISSTKAIIMGVWTIICALPFSAKLRWNFFLSATSVPISSIVMTGKRD